MTTGKTRHRLLTRLFGKPVLVLQVEVQEERTTSACGFIDTYPVTFWRDAEPTDLGLVKK